MITRRNFLKTSAVVAASFPLPLPAVDPAAKKLRIGIIADIHKDVIHDADARLETFISAMQREKVDAILQLGDFCVPKPANRAFVEIFHRFQGPRYHVIGNHDTDGGFKREAVMKFWGMEQRYYSFDLGGNHFIVLDANDRPPGWKGGYPHFIAPDQVEWLKQDLAKTTLNTFVISHQSFERPTCIDNQGEIRAVFDGATLPDGQRKVAGCLNGHWHLDHHRIINGIPYVHINSASYYWLGGKYKTERLAPEMAKQFPWVASTAPYARPLFTILEIDAAARRFSIQGMTSEWVGPSPQDLKFESAEVENEWVSPKITKGEWAQG